MKPFQDHAMGHFCSKICPIYQKETHIRVIQSIWGLNVHQNAPLFVIGWRVFSTIPFHITQWNVTTINLLLSFPYNIHINLPLCLLIEDLYHKLSLTDLKINNKHQVLEHNSHRYPISTQTKHHEITTVASTSTVYRYKYHSHVTTRSNLLWKPWWLWPPDLSWHQMHHPFLWRRIWSHWIGHMRQWHI